MPYDRAYDDDEEKQPESLGADRRFQDFDCPDCNANNPWDDGIGDGDEIRCYYCGQEFLAQVTDEGRLKLRAV
jgi:DNA-directed RNA polymerase subunit RPC12/RpoP